MDSYIIDKLASLEKIYFRSIIAGKSIEPLTPECEVLFNDVQNALEKHQLQRTTLQRVAGFARRLVIVDEGLARLDREGEAIMEDLEAKTRTLCLQSDTFKGGPRQAPIGDAGDLDPFHPLRLWFLDHFVNPYPDSKDKEHFLLVYPNHTKQQIDTWFTNIRRRSGWQDLKRRFTNGSVQDFARLVAEAEGEDRSFKAEEARKKIVQIKCWLKDGTRESMSEEIQQIVQGGAPTTVTKRKIAPKTKRRGPTGGVVKQPPSSSQPISFENLAPFDLASFNQPDLVSSPASLLPPSLSNQPRYPSTFSSPTSSLRSISNSSSSSFDSVVSYDSNSSFASQSPASPPASSSLLSFDSPATAPQPSLLPKALPPPRQAQPLPAPIENPYFFTVNNTPLLPLPVEPYADPVVVTSSLAGFASNGDIVV